MRGWTATRTARSARSWRPGWDVRGDRCPPDPGTEGRYVTGTVQVIGEDSVRTLPARRYTRHAGRCAGERWEANAATRQRAIRVLRQAGYLVRREWARERQADRKVGPHRVESWRWLEGPATGLEAIDPWRAATALSTCARLWAVHLLAHREARTVETMPAPRLCSRRHWCPSCAPRFSSRLAWALRTVIPEDHISDGLVSLGTLTQRDHPDETLHHALERFHRAWRLVTRGRRGAALGLEGLYYGLEATRGAQGKRGQRGRWWHVHAHVIVWDRPGRDRETLREWWRAAWADATATAALEAGIPGYGWDVAAGETLEHSWRPGLAPGQPATCRRCRRPKGTNAPCAPWWQPITDQRELYQAAKYPTPIADLHAVHLAEFLAAAHGRRWHQGSGTLRSVIRFAEELDPPDPSEPVRISDARPGAAPSLTIIAPEVGVRTDGGSRDRDREIRWRVDTAADVSDVELLRDAGWVIGLTDPTKPDGGQMEARMMQREVAARVRRDEQNRVEERRKRAETAAKTTRG